MKVAFLHAGQDPTCARIMIGSVRRHMPGVEIIHMADDDCPQLPEADSCVRMPWSGLKDDATVWRLKHLAAMDGEILSLDTDVVLQNNLGRVFDWDFDIAMARREGPIFSPNGIDLTKSMAFNTGIIWCRNNKVWSRCLEVLDESGDMGWYSDQWAANRVAHEFKFLKLHCDNFNYSPKAAGEDLSGRYAVHYKGNRKKWMVEDFGGIYGH